MPLEANTEAYGVFNSTTNKLEYTITADSMKDAQNQFAVMVLNTTHMKFDDYEIKEIMIKGKDDNIEI